MPRTAVAIVLAIVVLAPAAASGQVSAPGPYVIDLRGAMSGAPGSASFYPPVPTAIRVPQRAFGFGVGAHVYAFRIGAARLGFGVDLMRARGTSRTDASTVETSTTKESTGTFDAAMTVTTIAPQLSFNFGTHEGWSYLSGGYGASTTHAEVNIPASFAEEGGSRNRHASALNFGGGARWFLREHFAVGFDVRFHRVLASNAVPSTQSVGLSVGVSFR